MGPRAGDDPDHLERYARDAAVTESAVERARHRGLRRAAESDASLRGALADLAEREERITLVTVWGGTHSGTVTGLGHDMVILAADRSLIAVRLGAVATVRGEARRAPQARPEPVGGRDLAAVLADLAEDRQRVQLRCGSAPAVVGAVEAVGLDVVTVRLDGGASALVPLDAITEAVMGG